MAKFWALSTNDDAHVACAVAPYNEKIHLLTGDAVGWGLGYYSRGELLQRVEPKYFGEVLDVAAVVQDLRADLIVIHTRMATVGSPRRENIHPFRFKAFLFAHNGTTAGFDVIKEKLVNIMPSFIHRNIKGDTDSEYLFHLFLSFLYDAGIINRPDIGVIAMSDAIIRAFATVDELAAVSGARPPSPASIVVSDGYSAVVGSRGVPVDYAVINGISSCVTCRRSVNPGDAPDDGIAHEGLRAVLVRSADDDADAALPLTRLAENTLLLISKTHEITFRAFG